MGPSGPRIPLNEITLGPGSGPWDGIGAAKQGANRCQIDRPPERMLSRVPNLLPTKVTKVTTWRLPNRVPNMSPNKIPRQRPP